jgi:8-oxo-dGTP pyrophosphatase MutT (NUDIX family)
MHDNKETNLALIVAQIQKQIKRVTNATYTNNITGAGGLIYDPSNDKILVVKGREKWSLPKGHKELGEEPHETAMREICEETSIKIDIHSHHKFKRIIKCVYYLIIIDHGVDLQLEPYDREEISEIRWCNRNELLNLTCNKQLRYIVRSWDQTISFLIKNSNQISFTLRA